MTQMPRQVSLATLPTPLGTMARLRAALGGPSRCPKILIKRDDLTGLALGGNKARKLEFLIGDALQHEASVVVTTGAVQSNHARMTAAAAAAAGLRCELVLTADGDPPVQGNLLLDRLFGATIHYVPLPADPKLATSDVEEARVAEVIAALSARGERPYLIPVGGSSPIGVLGYLFGTRELVAQLDAIGERPTRLYFASGSRGTQAGLTLGAKWCGAPYQVYGVAVSGGEPWKRERAFRIANQAAVIAGLDTRVDAADLVTDQGYIGDGYGLSTMESLEAIHIVAETEGILLDPVYTAKAMACVIDHARRNLLDPEAPILFLHTGGVPALFAHAHSF
ncbi:MAG TPA: D-cysteine desulfhydrase family protein [Vicinamibacterales bacterium]|nr:D-cysteine desulfhydrase family protein [Vicinamibacterales bacterium]